MPVSTAESSFLEIRQRYCEATQNGKLSYTHYAKGLIIGDVGVGKSCVKNTLIGKPNVENEETHTFGVKQDTIETYSSSKVFHKVEESEREFSKAAVFLALYSKDFILAKVNSVTSEHLKKGCQLMVSFLCLLMCVCIHCGSTLNFSFLYVFSIIGALSMNYILDVPYNLYRYGQHLSIVCVVMKVICAEDSVWSHSNIATNYSSAKLGLLIVVVGIVISSLVIGISHKFSFTSGICCYFMATGESGISVSIFNDYNTIAKLIICIVIHFLIDYYATYFRQYFKSIEARHGIIPCLLFAIFYKSMPVFVTCASFSILFSLGMKLSEYLCDRQKYIVKRDIGHTIQYVIGVEIGIILSQYLDWQLHFSVFHTLLSLAIYIFVELFFCYQNQFDAYPADVVEHLQECGYQSWPVKVCLLDFAGSELFRDANHLFMGESAIYMIVLSLHEAILQPEYQLNRVIYWLNVVFAHTHYRNAKVILIGTNKSRCMNDEIKGFGLYLKDNLKKNFKDCLALNKNRNFVPLFAIDNMESMDTVGSDLDELHNAIWKYANDREFTHQNVPVQWVKFNDLIIHKRNLRRTGESEHLDCCITDVNVLYQEVKELCIVNDEPEFYKLLEFYISCGEIFYRMCDPRLYKYVILDPQIIMDCTACLAGQYLNSIPTHLQLHWDRLEQKGIASREMLMHLLKGIPGLREYYIAILQGLDLLVPIESQIGLLFSESDTYIVPFRLPLRLTSSRYNDDVEQFYFDFGPFNPQMIFLNLIAKCFQMSKFVAEQKELRVSDHDWTNNLYKDCVEFYYGDLFHYKIENLQNSIDRNIFLVSVWKIDHSASIFSLYGLLNGIILSLCKRDFPFVSYSVGVLCDCGDYHKVEHRNDYGPVKYMPISFRTTIEYKCKGETKIYTEKDAPHEELIRDQEISTHGIHSTAFISCSSEDRAWAQCELLPALQNILIPRKEIQFSTTHSQIMISFTPNERSRLSQEAKNQQFIVSSTCILVIISQNYLQNCINELHFAIKHCIQHKKRLIPILLDQCECPHELRIVKPLQYPSDEGQNVFTEFYLPLIKLFKDMSKC